MHYHMSMATFAEYEGDEYLVAHGPIKTTQNARKAWQAISDYLYALASLYNAEMDADISPDVVSELNLQAGDGEVVVEMKLTLPSGITERAKVTACDGELNDDTPVVVSIEDGDVSKLLDALGIGQSIPSNGIYH